MTKEKMQHLADERYPAPIIGEWEDIRDFKVRFKICMAKREAFMDGLASLLTQPADVQERAKEYIRSKYGNPVKRGSVSSIDDVGDAYLAGASSGMQWVKASEVPCKTKALPDIIITLVDGRPFAYDVKNNIKGLMNVLENRPDCLCLLINKPQP